MRVARKAMYKFSCHGNAFIGLNDAGDEWQCFGISKNEWQWFGISKNECFYAFSKTRFSLWIHSMHVFIS